MLSGSFFKRFLIFIRSKNKFNFIRFIYESYLYVFQCDLVAIGFDWVAWASIGLKKNLFNFSPKMHQTMVPVKLAPTYGKRFHRVLVRLHFTQVAPKLGSNFREEAYVGSRLIGTIVWRKIELIFLTVYWSNLG